MYYVYAAAWETMNLKMLYPDPVAFSGQSHS